MKKLLICKKTFFSLLSHFMLLLFIQPLFCQEIECLTINNNSSSLPLICTTLDDSPEHLATLPIRIIKVNFHWVENNDGSNFVDYDDPSGKLENGNVLAQKLIESANDKLANLEINPLALNGLNQLGDAKYRYELYSDPNNPNDKNGGVWYYKNGAEPTQLVDFPYQKNVINVIVKDDNSTDISRRGIGGKDGHIVELYRMQSMHYSGAMKWWEWDGFFNHETGHMLSLTEHSFENGPCNNIDIDYKKECNSPTALCDAWNSGSRNMMGYNECQCALSPCQWNRVYSFLSTNDASTPKWIKPIECAEFYETPDIVIDGKQDVNWDKMRFVNANIVVKTGSQLTISCKLLLGRDKRITVERGARLIVDAGHITKLCQEPWDGIYVHGNSSMAQPDPDTPFGSLNPDLAGIVDLKQDSKIEWAYSALNTEAPGMSWQDQQARWGGLIRAKNTVFHNNNKSVAFLQYPLKGTAITNKSSFVSCTFTRDADFPFLKPMGVTIWDSHGILFANIFFHSSFEYDIFGIDCSASIVNNNEFYEAKRAAIQTEGTYPNHKSVQMNISDNWFKSINVTTSYGINAVSGDNAPLAMKIYNNKFSNKIRTGVFVRTSASIVIHDNTFGQTGTIDQGIRVRNAGEGFDSAVKCNLFGKGTNNIVLEGNNSRVLFPGNYFEEPTLRNIRVQGSSSTLAEVSKNQRWAEIKGINIQAFDRPSSNFFNLKPQSQLLALPSTVEPFTYFTPEDIVTMPHGPQYYPDPANQAFALQDFKLTFPKPEKCSFNGTNPPAIVDDEPPVCTEDRIRILRRTISELKAQLIGNEEDRALAYEIDKKEMELRETIRCTEVYWIGIRDFDRAERILIEQEEPEFLRMAYGLKVKKGDYDGAYNFLQSLPNENKDDELFKRIQEINLRRFTSESKYELNAEEEAFLSEVALSDSKESGYARAILDLLGGIREYPEDSEEGSYRSLKEYTTATLKSNSRKENVFVSPNPVTGDFFEINIKDIKITDGYIQLTDMLGNVQLRQKFSSSKFERHSIDCSNILGGIYSVTITEGNIRLYEDKISILR